MLPMSTRLHLKDILLALPCVKSFQVWLIPEPGQMRWKDTAEALRVRPWFMNRPEWWWKVYTPRRTWKLLPQIQKPLTKLVSGCQNKLRNYFQKLHVQFGPTTTFPVSTQTLKTHTRHPIPGQMRCSLAWKFNLIPSNKPLKCSLIFSIAFPQRSLTNFWLIDWLNEWRISTKRTQNRRETSSFRWSRSSPSDTSNYCLDNDPLRLICSCYGGRRHLVWLRWCNGPAIFRVSWCLRPPAAPVRPWRNAKWCENMQTACALSKTVSTSCLSSHIPVFPLQERVSA